MEKFQDLYNNELNAHFEKIIFLSDTPVVGVIGALNKEIYSMMSTKEMLTVLKNSVPAEVLSGIGWGKSVTHEFPNQFRLEIVFTPEKTIKVEVIKLAVPKKEEAEVEQVVARKEAPVVDPEVLDNLMQADALIYYNSEEPKQLMELLGKAGYEVRASNDPNACMQALNYKDFSIVGLVIRKDVFSDSVFSHLLFTNMQARRKQFSFLVTEDVEAGNPDLAFSFSVSMVLDYNSIKDFDTHFSKNYQSWKRIVDPFIEVIDSKV